jgi:uncharacterized protein (TIGR02246 family)
VDAIRKQVDAWTSAFNNRDAKAIAAFWTKEGEYVDESGTSLAGRAAVEAYFADVFAKNAPLKIQLASDSIRLLNENLAIEDGKAIISADTPSIAEVSKYTTVYTKVDGKWLIASLRDSYLEGSEDSKALEDLGWLIGDWVAEENGAKTESKCRWILNKRFVERSYTTTMVDGSVSHGLQIIGWNSQSKHVQSWTFSEDGGHAIGVWSATDSGWLAKVNGHTGANISTTAVNVLKRLDDNAYVWQSTARTAGDMVLPDTDEVIIRRKAATR